MRVDLYTKIVLTIIAACLLFSAFKSVFSPREATAGGSQSVWVEGGYIEVEGTVDVQGSVTVDGTVDVSSSYICPVKVEVTNPW